MAYLKSVLWLLGTGALGYTLLLVTTPDEKQIAEKYPDSRSPDALKRRQNIVEALKKAADNKNPMYRQTKEQIESDMQIKDK